MKSRTIKKKAKVPVPPVPPMILAPAGSREAFLAALAAGADAVYCGLKRFSARMAAENFSPGDLTPLAALARERGVKVFVALNSLVRPDELDALGGLLAHLQGSVQPDGIIVQDLAAVQLARQCGYGGEIHFSTLANVSFPQALARVRDPWGADRVVLPRELNIDEIKQMADACPPDLGLEVFVHGALCYGVSGRCYWSSFMGGKSGLRGRCVQPCRRRYFQGEKPQRLFSCQDLSLDVLVKLLLSIPQVRAWKIEGRKKGPHYVYYTVQAYRLLRDHLEEDASPKGQVKKNALELLAYALGRSTTHSHFLPQRPQNPVQPRVSTGSGLFVGKLRGGERKPFLQPRIALLPNDLLRFGSEEQKGHRILGIARGVPAKGKLFVNPPLPAGNSPAYLIDRRETHLSKALGELEDALRTCPPGPNPVSSDFRACFSQKNKKLALPEEVRVYRGVPRKPPRGPVGRWISLKSVKRTMAEPLPDWWWLPPVLWPGQAALLGEAVQAIQRKDGRNFVVNAPWQAALFKIPRSVNLWAGPFCNITNGLAVAALADAGFSGVIASPELDHEGFLALPGQSPLPLGAVLTANWPLCVSRLAADAVRLNEPFTSPKRETAWIQKIDDDFWVFPNWRLDFRPYKNELQQAGYQLWFHLFEEVPASVVMKRRPGGWNWELGLQ